MNSKFNLISIKKLSFDTTIFFFQLLYGIYNASSILNPFICFPVSIDFMGIIAVLS